MKIDCAKLKKKKNNESFVTLFPHKINNKIKDSR